MRCSTCKYWNGKCRKNGGLTIPPDFVCIWWVRSGSDYIREDTDED